MRPPVSSARPLVPPKKVTEPRSGRIRSASPPAWRAASCANAPAGTRASSRRTARGTTRRRAGTIRFIIGLLEVHGDGAPAARRSGSIGADRPVARIGRGVEQREKALGQAVDLALARLVRPYRHEREVPALRRHVHGHLTNRSGEAAPPRQLLGRPEARAEEADRAGD